MKAICIASFVFSCIALAVSLWTYKQADARAERALQRREQAIVHRYEPVVDRICKDFGLEDGPRDPRTFEELLDPLSGLLKDLDR